MKNKVMARFSRAQFERICNESSSVAEICRRLGYSVVSSAYRSVYKRAAAESVSLGHLAKSNRGRSFPKQRAPVDKVLQSGNRGWIKKVFLREGLLNNLCALCGMPPEWRGRPLVMRLDHIDGDSRNNVLDNLRLVCPNCDSQLPTFSGRNNTPKYTCIDCGGRVGKGSRRCIGCHNRALIRPTKITWPSLPELKARLKETTYESVARELGVSSNAIRKRLRNYG